MERVQLETRCDLVGREVPRAAFEGALLRQNCGCCERDEHKAAHATTTTTTRRGDRRRKKKSWDFSPTANSHMLSPNQSPYPPHQGPTMPIGSLLAFLTSVPRLAVWAYTSPSPSTLHSFLSMYTAGYRSTCTRSLACLVRFLCVSTYWLACLLGCLASQVKSIVVNSCLLFM